MASKTPQFVHQVSEVTSLLAAAATLAATSAPVLLLGPRCSSIDLLAQAVHASSLREARPFVMVRCGLYPAATVERELLSGPAKIANSAAAESPQNAVQQASGGTLFIDQIQNASPIIQNEILRLITDRQYEDPTDGTLHPADVRIIASAWHDLGAKADAGIFRPDLSARLHSLSLRLPKGYKDKCHLLEVVDFLAACAPSDPRLADLPPEAITLKSALSQCVKIPPPPNAQNPRTESLLLAALRKLEHDKAHLLARQNLLAVASAVERCVDTQEVFEGHLYQTLTQQMQRTLIRRVLAQTGGSLTRAAIILGISLYLLESQIRDLGLA